MNKVQEVQEIRLEAITFCKYRLQIANKSILLSFPQLLALRNQVNKHTSHEVLEQTINGSNMILLFMADREHLVLLDVPQLIGLQEEIETIFYLAHPTFV
ncbi:MAG: hypothetical protein CMB99_10165 [Flavobacteriaceae bacterium]|nr:hypothetical protein [Flavobacteriaceae bacterium]|tara:strand:- start:308912 stop:309211 length:300 start_codon:yes stop_codon:yes gene_type:complete